MSIYLTLIPATTVKILEFGATLNIFFSAVKASLGFTDKITKSKFSVAKLSNLITFKFFSFKSSTFLLFLSMQLMLDDETPLLLIRQSLLVQCCHIQQNKHS